MDVNDNACGTVSQFYSEKCIFITGATGFMGKVLLNKLLQSCPMLESIYVLIRPKRDELPQGRVSNKGTENLNPNLKFQVQVKFNHYQF